MRIYLCRYKYLFFRKLKIIKHSLSLLLSPPLSIKTTKKEWLKISVNGDFLKARVLVMDMSIEISKNGHNSEDEPCLVFSTCISHLKKYAVN